MDSHAVPRYSVLYFMIMMPWSTKLSWVLSPVCSAALPHSEAILTICL